MAKRKSLEARANQLCHFFKRGSCTACSFCLKSHAASASKEGLQQGGVDVSLIQGGEPILDEEGVYVQSAYNGRKKCSVRSAPSANHGGHQKEVYSFLWYSTSTRYVRSTRDNCSLGSASDPLISACTRRPTYRPWVSFCVVIGLKHAAWKSLKNIAAYCNLFFFVVIGLTPAARKVSANCM